MPGKLARTALWLVGLSVLLVGATTFVAGQQATANEWTGQWTLTFETGRGPQETPLSIKSEGGTLKATIVGRGGSIPSSDVKIERDTLSIKYSLPGRGGDSEAVIKLIKQSDGKFTATRTIGENKATGTAARKRCPPDCE